VFTIKKNRLASGKSPENCPVSVPPVFKFSLSASAGEVLGFLRRIVCLFLVWFHIVEPVVFGEQVCPIARQVAENSLRFGWRPRDDRGNQAGAESEFLQVIIQKNVLSAPDSISKQHFFSRVIHLDSGASSEIELKGLVELSRKGFGFIDFFAP